MFVVQACVFMFVYVGVSIYVCLCRRVCLGLFMQTCLCLHRRAY